MRRAGRSETTLRTIKNCLSFPYQRIEEFVSGCLTGRKPHSCAIKAKADYYSIISYYI